MAQNTTPTTNPHDPADLTATIDPEALAVMERLFQDLAVKSDSDRHFWLMVQAVPDRVEANPEFSDGFRAGFRDAWEAMVLSHVLDAAAEVVGELGRDAFRKDGDR